ncbi:MAG: hypothetical protein J5I90_14565 [Caldilineales bacterium]|nr:hypothetical protein [Caldilineales bacterium]
MRLPADLVIPDDKLTQYLLAPRPRNDKSRFLERAGFTVRNHQLLANSIRQQATGNDAIIDRNDNYGTFYRVEGILVGPIAALAVVTIWLQDAHSDVYRFITLKPLR